MNDKVCLRCGSDVPEQGFYCPHCGARVSQANLIEAAGDEGFPGGSLLAEVYWRVRRVGLGYGLLALLASWIAVSIAKPLFYLLVLSLGDWAGAHQSDPSFWLVQASLWLLGIAATFYVFLLIIRHLSMRPVEEVQKTAAAGALRVLGYLFLLVLAVAGLCFLMLSGFG